MLFGSSRSSCPGSRSSIIGRIMPAATTAEPLSSVQLPLAMKKVSRSGVSIFLIHKGACDRKAVTIKSHIRIYLNAGNNIETPEQIRDAILSFGGVPGVNVALCETVQVPRCYLQLSNVEYKEEGLLVWRAYSIGDGKLIPTDKLHCPSPSDLPTLTKVTRS